MRFDSVQDIESWLIRSLNEATGVPIDDIKPEMSFANLGVDSIESVQLACELDANFDAFTIKPEIFWEVDNIRELALELHARTMDDAVEASASVA